MNWQDILKYEGMKIRTQGYNLFERRDGYYYLKAPDERSMWPYVITHNGINMVFDQFAGMSRDFINERGIYREGQNPGVNVVTLTLEEAQNKATLIKDTAPIDFERRYAYQSDDDYPDDDV